MQCAMLCGAGSGDLGGSRGQDSADLTKNRAEALLSDFLQVEVECLSGFGCHGNTSKRHSARPHDIPPDLVCVFVLSFWLLDGSLAGCFRPGFLVVSVDT